MLYSILSLQYTVYVATSSRLLKSRLFLSLTQSHAGVGGEISLAQYSMYVTDDICISGDPLPLSLSLA